MRLPKLTAFLLILALASCDKEPTKREQSYSKTNPVTASQNVISPALPTPGSGTIDVEFTPVNKLLNYTVKWSNLTDSVIAIRINGPAPAGSNAFNTSFTGASPTSPSTTPHTVVQEFVGTTTKSLYGKSGSMTNSLAVDGVKVKEEYLTAGLYYVTIHTKTIIPAPITPPSSLAYRWIGELRGQITVQ